MKLGPIDHCPESKCHQEVNRSDDAIPIVIFFNLYLFTEVSSFRLNKSQFPTYQLCPILIFQGYERGRGSPSVMSGFSISVQPAAPVSPIGLLCEQ